jgi:DNA-binding transcriptional LysR family regulator
MAKIELKHLSILDEIYKTQSVTKAAANLGLSQPSISVGLARLRQHFSDPLFVRTSAGMKPTPYAAQLVKPLGEALRLFDQIRGGQVQFDPSSSDRTFKICMADLGNMTILPRLLKYLKETAPSIRVEVIALSAETPHLLESGAADLAIGVPSRLQAGFYQQRLFREDFVCLVRANHPRIRSQLTLKQFLSEEHIALTSPWASPWIIERFLEAKKLRRKIALRVPSFLGLAKLVAATDLVVTVPRLTGNEFSLTAEVKVLSPPVNFPSYLVRQYWHARYHHDPQNKWIRAVVPRLFPG